MNALDVSPFHPRLARFTQLSGTCRGLRFGVLCGWFLLVFPLVWSVLQVPEMF